MIYKNYRTILIVKIILLCVASTLMYFSDIFDLSSWWVTFMFDAAPSQSDIQIVKETIESHNWPYTILAGSWSDIYLHIAPTRDGWSVIRYIENGLPIIQQPLKENTYFTHCEKKVLFENNSYEIQRCSTKRWVYSFMFVILVLFWIVL